MTAFATALNTLHADANMGTAASYRLPPYTAQSVRVILSNPTDAFGASVAGTMQADILAADVTDAPERGAELTIAGTTYKVETVERDVLGLSWRLALSKPAED